MKTGVPGEKPGTPGARETTNNKLNPHMAYAENKINYYSTIMSFYHIRSREQAKYEAVIHRSVLV